jgi:hypothetical protein
LATGGIHRFFDHTLRRACGVTRFPAKIYLTGSERKRESQRIGERESEREREKESE